jgi:hypothetical protein
MNNKNAGILMIVVGVLLAILYFAIPTFLVYTYWLAILIFVLYGLYLFQKG